MQVKGVGNTYVCPMHPKMHTSYPGKCPKCGMALVEKSALQSGSKTTWKNYSPLFIILGLLVVISLTISYADFLRGIFSFSHSISYFMIGFFLVFSGFKLLDIQGFAQGYATYDLLAKKWYSYGYIYPFIELFFGISMILAPFSHLLLWTEIFVMTFSGLGVSLKLLKKEKFQCACLGTFLKVPLTKITLIEDFGMAVLGIFLLH